ncbi:hypothetical protein L600_001500000530 [Isoptericola variabilis J7]|nr:hypothetical protein L600_001500000530 [Isoptericola variabilis J7]
MGAISAGERFSTSVYQSTACHRSGSDRYARATTVRSKPTTAGSSGDSVDPSADSNVPSSSVGRVRRARFATSPASRRTTVKR